MECVGRDSGRSSRLKSTSPCSSCWSSSRAELASSDSTAPCICCTEAADSIDVPAPAPSASARSGSSAGSSSLQRRALPAFSTALPLAEDASAGSVAAVAGCDALTAGCTPSGAAIGCAPSDPATEVVVTAPWPPLSIRAIIGGRGMPDGAENMLAALQSTDYRIPPQRYPPAAYSHLHLMSNWGENAADHSDFFLLFSPQSLASQPTSVSLQSSAAYTVSPRGRGSAVGPYKLICGRGCRRPRRGPRGR